MTSMQPSGCRIASRLAGTMMVVSASVIAAYHRESLVPAAILMALVGYAMGNYLAILTGHLCRIVGGA